MLFHPHTRSLILQWLAADKREHLRTIWLLLRAISSEFGGCSQSALGCYPGRMTNASKSFLFTINRDKREYRVEVWPDAIEEALGADRMTPDDIDAWGLANIESLTAIADRKRLQMSTTDSYIEIREGDFPW